MTRKRNNSVASMNLNVLELMNPARTGDRQCLDRVFTERAKRTGSWQVFCGATDTVFFCVTCLNTRLQLNGNIGLSGPSISTCRLAHHAIGCAPNVDMPKSEPSSHALN
jgi:hypothetical protein